MVAPVETPPPTTPLEQSLDRFEHQIEELEGLKSRWRWLRWTAWILVIGGVGTALVLMEAPARSPVSTAVKGVMSLELSQPKSGVLAKAPTEFRWESISGRSSYSFKLTPLGGQTPIIERSVKENSLNLTVEEAAGLTKGKSYVWQVEALSKQKEKLAAGQSYFDL